MIQDQQKYFFPLQLLLDFLCALSAYLVCAPLALAISGDTSAADAGSATLQLSKSWKCYLSLAPLMLLLPPFFLYLTNSYTHTGIQKLRWIIQSTGNASMITACFILSISILYPVELDVRSFLMLFFPLSWLAFVGNRLLIVPIACQARSNSNLTKHLLIIGTDRQALAAAELFAKHRDWGIVVAGFLSGEDQEPPCPAAEPVLGGIADLPDILTSTVVDGVLLISGVTDIGTIRNISVQCEMVGMDFGFSASAFSEKYARITAEQLDGLSAVFLKTFAHAPEKLFLKRIFDIAAAALLILLLAPFWIVIPVWIRRTSPGPALYAQERVGKRGRRFHMYKFRTMVVGADQMLDKLAHLNEMDGPVFKIKNDPRFTSIGQFLRSTSIDELPQLFNVLRGDMSLVGPRPPIMKEVVRYTPWQLRRLSVMPGITCLWQVTGRNEIKFDEWMQLDLQYIENWSLILDMKILIQTLTAVISRRGAE